MEQLPVKIKGGNNVSICENYGVLFLCLLLFVCVFLQKRYRTMGFGQFVPLSFGGFWVQKAGSITGPRLGQYWAAFGLMLFLAHAAQLLTQDSCCNSCVLTLCCLFSKSHSPCRKKTLFSIKINKETAAQSLTLQRAKYSPIIEPTTYIYRKEEEKMIME